MMPSGAFQAGRRLPPTHAALSHLQHNSCDFTAASTIALLHLADTRPVSHSRAHFRTSVHGQAPPELSLGPARLAKEASSWTLILPSARAPDLLGFTGTCLQPPLGGSLRTLGGLGQALVKAVGSCVVAACAEEADRALLLLGTLCEQLGPDRVSHCHAGQVQRFRLEIL